MSYKGTLLELKTKLGIPTKNTTTSKGKSFSLYYKDIADKTIMVGDTLEIKSLVGGYGRTDIFIGVLISINQFGTFMLNIKGKRVDVSVYSELNFDLLSETATELLMVNETTTTHGCCPMDVHAHDTYVKILS